MRLDIYVAQKLGVSRNRAQFFIQQKKILVNNIMIEKEAYQVQEHDNVICNVDEINYVSRSALKLKGFIEMSDMKIQDTQCLDVGSSTGGFTQILLEKGAKKVYSLDVGTSQLHESLRTHPKICSIENTDIRKFDASCIVGNLDIIVCDVSFIRLELILDSLIALMQDETQLVLLFKPQYEVGSENLNKLGIPNNIKIVQEFFEKFCLILQSKGVKIQGVKDSILPGENGNKEIFVLSKKICQTENEIYHP